MSNAPFSSTSVEIQLHGRTGDGKTTFAALLAKSLGAADGTHPFVPRGGAHSHTMAPVSYCADGITIVDNPGLMDSEGVEKDERNLKLIVDHARERGHVNAFVLVMNEQSSRFDAGMQDCVKLLFDSFGPEIIDVFAIVFTRCDGRVSDEDSRNRSQDIAELIKQRVGLTHTATFPVFRVESRVDSWNDILKEQAITKLRIQTEQSVKNLLRFARNQACVSTKDAVYGEYEERRKVREAEENGEAVVAESEANIRETKQKDAATVAERMELVKQAKACEEMARKKVEEVEKEMARRDAAAIEAENARKDAELARAENDRVLIVLLEERIRSAEQRVQEAVEGISKAESEKEEHIKKHGFLYHKIQSLATVGAAVGSIAVGIANLVLKSQ